MSKKSTGADEPNETNGNVSPLDMAHSSVTRAEALIQCQKDVLERIVAGHDLAQTLELLTAALEANAQRKTIATIMVASEDEKFLYPAAGKSAPPAWREFIALVPIGPGVGSCGACAFQRERVIVPDIATDPRWAQFKEVALGLGLRACWSTPILSANKTVLGTYAIYYPKPSTPSRDEMEMVEMMTRTAAVAIQNASLYQALQRELAVHKEAEITSRRLAAIVEGSDDGIIAKNLQGIIQSWNGGAERIFGFTAEEIVGQSITRLIPDDRLQEEAHILSQLRSGKRIDHFETVRRRKDGRLLNVAITVSPVRDFRGEIIGASKIVRDITEVREAETMRNRLAAIVESSDDAIIGLDLKTTITAWNRGAERVFGYSAAEVVGKSVLILIPEGYEDEEPRILERLIKGERVERYETIRRRKDGSLVNVSLTVSPIYDGSGEVVGASKISRDLTGDRQAEVMRRRLAAIVESSDDAIIGLDLDTTITAWNRGAERTFGYKADEVIGHSVNLLIPPEREDEEPRLMARLRHGERIEHYETVRRRKDGRLIDVSLAVSAIHDANGAIIGASKISRDITETKRQQQALKRSEEELRAMADSFPQLAWMAQPDGFIYWYNERWFDYTGTTMKGMEGWGWQTVHHPDHLPAVVAHWKKCIADGTAFEMEFPLRGADGVFRWFLTRVIPFRDPSGAIVRWFGTNTEIDELRRTQQALREETSTLEILNDTGKAIASELELEKIVQTVTDSATKLTGAKFGAFFYNTINEEGESFMLFTLSGAPREAFERFGQPRATPLFGPTFKGQPPIRCDDVRADARYGQWAPDHGMPAGHLPVRSYLAVPVISRTGEVFGGLFFGHPEVGVFTERSERVVVGMAAQAAVAMDNARLISDLREAREQLTQHKERLEEEVAQRTSALKDTIQELEAFSYSVSHDMRSPLRAMQGYADALLVDYKSKLDPTGVHYLTRIHRGAKRMDLLIQDVLAYSRVAKGDIQLATVNVGLVINDVIQNYPALHPDRARITVTGEIPLVIGHEAYLTQIVSNLLGNAVKFIHPGTFPTVDISAQEEGGVVRISFCDNGIGISPEQQREIFQIFGRVYPEKTFEGTGIGLAIVKKAAERMGGSVGVSSRFGCGSEFFVILRKSE